ncbi:MAG TPA: hypothetical protein VN370_05455 [Desulfitobacteriaceae bacterium]|nr:hypothetical protein [Desulfitobacteriaceae bacterium]
MNVLSGLEDLASMVTKRYLVQKAWFNDQQVRLFFIEEKSPKIGKKTANDVRQYIGH